MSGAEVLYTSAAISSGVLRTSTVLLRPTGEQDVELRKLADASSGLWNMAVYERRQAFFKRSKMPSYGRQYHEFRDTRQFRALGTCKGQALLMKLAEAWDSFWALKRLQKQGKQPPDVKKVSPPTYWKEDGRRVLRAIYVRNDGWRNLEEKGLLSVSRTLKVPYTSGQM